MKENTYKLILSKEEMNVIRNGMNLILSSFKDMLTDEAKELYANIKVRFDMEYKMQSKWKEISFEDLCDNLKDNWQLQYKYPDVGIWIDYDIKKATIASFIMNKRMNVIWRYKVS